jgi:hypothetical protein
MDVGCDLGIARDYQEMYMRYYPPDGWCKMIDLIHPLNSWSKKEDTRANEASKFITLNTLALIYLMYLLRRK